MSAEPKHREAIVATAAKLFRRQGYAATGLNEISAVSGAPKGSLYHYFPGGKAQIGAAAVRAAGAVGAKGLSELAEKSNSPGEFIRSYGERLSGWLEASGYREGCPIATTLLEVAPIEAEVTAAGRDVLSSWADIVAQILERSGLGPKRSRTLGRFTIAAIEGALLQARVEQSAQAIRAACGELEALFQSAIEGETRA